MKPILVSFISGAVFAAGLGIGGMTQPAKVIGFLDFAGDWDPSLVLVMFGAIGVHSLFYHMVRKRPGSRFSLEISLPSRTEIDLRLIGGSIIFGLGWGLAGYCPGPAITSLASGTFSAVIFSAGMIAGVIAFDFKRALSGWRADAEVFSREISQDV